MSRPRDPLKVEAWLTNLSKSKMGSNNPNYGKSLSEVCRKRLREAHKNRIVSEETCKKISLAVSGVNNHNYGKPMHENTRQALEKSRCGNKYCAGLKHSLETRLKISQSNMGRTPTEETRYKLSARQTGEKNHNWKGGISKFPYCGKFNERFKERVRAFFNYTCVECGTVPTTRAVHVHHVAYDKKVCCNDNTPLFVALCQTCHNKTQSDRNYWEHHFTEIINTYYLGKCYLTEKEYGALCKPLR